MSANLVDAQVFVLLHKARQSRHERAGWAVQSLERADRAGHFAGIHMQGAESRIRGVLGECGSAEQQWAEAIA